MLFGFMTLNLNALQSLMTFDINGENIDKKNDGLLWNGVIDTSIDKSRLK